MLDSKDRAIVLYSGSLFTQNFHSSPPGGTYTDKHSSSAQLVCVCLNPRHLTAINVTKDRLIYCVRILLLRELQKLAKKEYILLHTHVGNELIFDDLEFTLNKVFFKETLYSKTLVLIE